MSYNKIILSLVLVSITSFSCGSNKLNVHNPEFTNLITEESPTGIADFVFVEEYANDANLGVVLIPQVVKRQLGQQQEAIQLTPKILLKRGAYLKYSESTQSAAEVSNQLSIRRELAYNPVRKLISARKYSESPQSAAEFSNQLNIRRELACKPTKKLISAKNNNNDSMDCCTLLSQCFGIK
jgi:hypothetical protein